MGHQVSYMSCDISNKIKVSETWSKILETHGKVDILVNNAARSIGRRIKNLEIEAYQKTMDVNFTSLVQLSMLFLKQ